MKRYAIHGKNIAALLMLLALISLLLPFCKITTPKKSVTVSGIEVVKIGAKTTAEYLKNGTIKNEYVIADHLTWGDIKSGADYASKHQEIQKAVIAAAICLLPILFCFLAMVFTFIAEGKKTMFFPTLLLAATVLENIILILGFSRFQEIILAKAGGEGIELALLVGISIFTVLCAIALVILLILWVCGGFNRPDYEEDSKNKNGREKKDKSSGRGRRKKKRRRKKTSKKSKRDKGKNEQEEPKKEQQRRPSVPVGQPGILNGCSGIYQGIKCDITTGHAYTLGTTPEAMDVIRSGSITNVEKLNGNNYVIQFNPENKQYTITNRSEIELHLIHGNGTDQMVHLGNGASATVPGNTVLHVGSAKDAVKLN